MPSPIRCITCGAVSFAAPDTSLHCHTCYETLRAEVGELRAENERLRELAIYSTEEGTQMYWRDIAEAKTEKMNEWAQTIQDINADAARYRVEAERLRRACLQVREWGIELASLQPAEREQRFIILWRHINQTLRTAAQKTDKVTEPLPAQALPSWHMPTRACGKCGAPLAPVAVDTGDGWFLGWDACDHLCDDPADLEAYIEWPFTGNWASVADLRRLGFRIE